MFNCPVDNFPMKNLGVLVTFANLQNVERDFWNVEYVKKLDVWICNAASSGASLTLLHSFYLGFLLTIWLCFCLTNFCRKLDKVRFFLWVGKKKWLIIWSRRKECRSKNKGGLDGLQKQNIKHLCK
jgi:hypothetical protein